MCSFGKAPPCSGGSVVRLAAVRATSKHKQELGAQSKVLTPVRRSVRTPKQQADAACVAPTSSLLRGVGHVFAPNAELAPKLHTGEAIVTKEAPAKLSSSLNVTTNVEVSLPQAGGANGTEQSMEIDPSGHLEGATVTSASATSMDMAPATSPAILADALWSAEAPSMDAPALAAERPRPKKRRDRNEPAAEAPRRSTRLRTREA